MKMLAQIFAILMTLLVLSNCATVQEQQKLNVPIPQDNASKSISGVMAKVVSVTPIHKISSSERLPSPNDAQTQIKPAQKDATAIQNEVPQTEYQVIFEFKGQTFSTQLPFDPGEQLLIQDTPPQISNAAPTNLATSLGNLTYTPNELYILPPVGLNLSPYPSYGFFTAFPVYFSGGYYHRLPGRFHLNHGDRIHLNGGGFRGRGRK